MDWQRGRRSAGGWREGGRVTKARRTRGFRAVPLRNRAGYRFGSLHVEVERMWQREENDCHFAELDWDSAHHRDEA